MYKKVMNKAAVFVYNLHASSWIVQWVWSRLGGWTPVTQPGMCREGEAGRVWEEGHFTNLTNHLYSSFVFAYLFVHEMSYFLGPNLISLRHSDKMYLYYFAVWAYYCVQNPSCSVENEPRQGALANCRVRKTLVAALAAGCLKELSDYIDISVRSNSIDL